MIEFTDEEIVKLKQLVCDHEPKNDLDECYCCGNIHYTTCTKCNKQYSPVPDCHEDSPTCNMCD